MYNMLKGFYKVIFSSKIMVLIALSFLSLTSFYHLLNSNLPLVEGVIELSGISAPVLINRDEYGVPDIEAENFDDLYFAIGFVQAQDRFWQMEVQRNLAKGRLAEVFGAKYLSDDIFLRKLGLYNSTKSAWNSLSKEAQRSLASYASGINAYLKSNKANIPELTLFSISPEPWSPLDSLAMAKLFSLNLSGNLNQELKLNLVQSVLSDNQIKDLFGASFSKRQTKEKYVGLLGSTNRLEKFHLHGGKNIGSNAWAISGKYTSSGSAIISSDPHLNLQIPSTWYALVARVGDSMLSGMTIPGLPVIIFGRNNDIAWGGTNLPADTQDLVEIQLHPENRNLYLYDGEWLEFSERNEKFVVAPPFPAVLNNSFKPVNIKVKTTRYGPVVFEPENFGGAATAIRWTALMDADTSYESFFKINKSRDWQDFSAALSHLVTPSLNMLYADNENNIGYQAAGKIPKRQSWTEQSDFTFIDWVEMPREFNPARGFIVNANNDVFGEDFPYKVSTEWADPARATRIKDLLLSIVENQQKIDIEFNRQMQLDTLDLNAGNLISLSSSYLREFSSLETIAEELDSWNGEMLEDSYAPVLYMEFLRELKHGLLNDELTQFYRGASVKSSLLSVIDSIEVNTIVRLVKQVPIWCDDIATLEQEKCDLLVKTSMEKAILNLKKEFGTDMGKWRWKDYSQTKYQYYPMSDKKIVAEFLDRTSGRVGTTDTVNVAGVRYLPTEGYIQTIGAGFRQIIEMTPGEYNYLFINSTGQSGSILSEHYDDMIDAFEVNELRKVGDASIVKSLKLIPTSIGEGLQ